MGELPQTDATRLGDEIRAGRSEASPAFLWSVAGDGDDYRHAMIHAGWIVKRDEHGGPGPPYRECPRCGAELGGGDA